MVLTRAQRAQANDMPPEPPSQSSLLKAPVRRGRPKKTDAEQAPRPAPKPAAPKPASNEDASKTGPLKSSVSKASTSARTATTKSSAAKTIAPKTTRTTAAPKASTDEIEVEASKKTVVKKATTRTLAPKEKENPSEIKAQKETLVKKASAAKSTGPKTLTIKTASLKASIPKKPPVPKRATKTSKAVKVAESEDDEDELAMDKKQVEVQDFAMTQVSKEVSTTTHTYTAREEPVEDTMVASAAVGPSKIPLSALAIAQPTPVKLPRLSPSKVVGSVRKPVVSSVLFASPAKPKAAIEHVPSDLGSPKRAKGFEETIGLAKSPVRPNAISEQPAGQDPFVAEEAAGIFRSPVRPAPTPARPCFSQSTTKAEKTTMISQSPVKPNTAMKRGVLSQSTSILEKPAGICQTPIRPSAIAGQNLFKQSLSQSAKAPNFTVSTSKRSAVPLSDSVLVPAKRLRTSLSMPALDFGLPKQTSSIRSGSPLSPVKSSMRSPEKQRSPKKVSWHQSPPRQPVMAEEPAEQTGGPLDGLVFFLDVNNTEGVDSNKLFAPLVEQLGGEVVSDWTSNSMGVTHVVFMNGEMRTLEKIVATNGKVHCVNISWVLDCEREHTHLDEKEFKYAIDLTRIPGLITPKSSYSYNSLATPIASRTPAAPPPSHRHFTFAPTTPAREPLGMIIKTPSYFAPKTPASVGLGNVSPAEWDDKENVSPETNSPLLQKTCPPKQQSKSLFSLDNAVTPFGKRLAFVRRRRSFEGGFGA
ncbi:hypothetical protein FKW77_009672 [Venturia effusa]|uniref:BRCT domain-containing protein n=1 Tax=Venturia effusa TaxID=50376 RepID=A0A517L086_9PEZI|nr:hypothetical protein FKW77_009672 [Venturia effusa]